MDRLFHGIVAAALLCAPLVAFPEAASAQQPSPPAEPADDAQTRPAPSPLVGEPTTPAELLEAALLMVDITRLDLARGYLDKLLEQQLAEDTLLELRDRFGAASLLRLAGIKELRDPATKLLDLTNVAATRRESDPERISALITQLDGSLEEQAQATAELQSLGVLAVPGLLRVLGDRQRAPLHGSVMTAILQVGDPAIPLLLGALDAPSEEVRAHVAGLLGHLRSREAESRLWHPAYSDQSPPAVRQAARHALARILRMPDAEIERVASRNIVGRLLNSAKQHLHNEFPWKTENDGQVTLWSYDAAEGGIVARTLPPEVASEQVGLKLATDALALAPDQRPVQVLYLAHALAADLRRAGFDRPLAIGPGTAHDLALSVGPDVLSEVLATALNSGRPHTAVAALTVLSQIGTRAHLSRSISKRPAIIAALDYPDPRVQFAAASAILQLDPQSPFRGSTRVVEILARAASAGDRAVALVGEVSTQRAALVVGILQDLGYEAIAFASGRELFVEAARRSDVDLIVLHPNMIRWPLSETLANLRADSRTGGIPIVIHGPAGLRDKMRHHERVLRLVSFASEAQSTADFELQVEPFLRQIKTPPMDSAQRARHREAAIDWLAHIAQGRRTRIFDLSHAEAPLIEALVDPSLAARAIDAVVELASAESQEALFRVAVAQEAAPEVRESAALKLAFHIQRYGLLLKARQLEELHRAWRNEREPAALRTALAGVIGSLKPDAALVGKRLLGDSLEAR